VPKFAANLSMMFQDLGFLDRFDAAARAGFKGIEFLFPYDHTPEEVAGRLERNGLSLALFNTVPGDWAGGERGLAAQPGREQEFRDGVDKAIIYAKATKCPLLHAMAGLWPDGRDKAEGERVYIDNLRWAADRMAALLTDLLQLSRVGRKQSAPERVPLSELLNEVTGLIVIHAAERDGVDAYTLVSPIGRQVSSEPDEAGLDD